jgi:hypothetical protein
MELSRQTACLPLRQEGSGQRMSTLARFLVVTALAVLVVGGLWWRDDGATIPEPVPMQTNEPTVVTRVPVTSVVVSPTAPTAGNAADPPPSPRAAPDDGIAVLVRKLADRLYTTVGPQFVEHLVSKGLSRTDSERVVADMMPDWVRCQVDATLAQADEQSISRADVFAVLDAQGLFAFPPQSEPQLDMRAAIARAQQCRFGVQQRIGIAPGDFALRPTGR